jgi:hypothetical protein
MADEEIEVCSYEIDMAREGISKMDSLKAIQRRFGNDWNGIMQEKGIKNVEVNVQTAVMKLQGSLDTVKKVLLIRNTL